MSYPNVSGVRNGIVAVVSLNPAASTAFVDPELDQAASAIETGKYVAILSGLSVDQDGNSLTNMYFIGPGMPRKNRQYDEDESMCIPLSPAKTNPLRRRPLQLQQPLPWPECYVRTLLTERQARISSVIAPSSVAPIVLQDADLKDLVGLCEADLRRTSPTEIVMPASSTGSDEDLSSGDRDDDGWHVELNSRPSKLLFTFDVWLDMGVLAELPDPGGLRKELEMLYILQDRDTRRHYAQYRRMSRTTRLDPPQLNDHSASRSKPSRGQRFRSWISRLFRKIFRRTRSSS